jgi:hypothetical protein
MKSKARDMPITTGGRKVVNRSISLESMGMMWYAVCDPKQEAVRILYTL